MNRVATKLDAHSVAYYLQQHPEFFNTHLELLETLYIPHPVSGNAVSLIAKQLELFRHKQQKLEAQLSELTEIARENNLSANRIQQLTLALLNSPSFSSAITNLHWVFKEVFLTDFIALKIVCENTNPAFSDIFISTQHKDYEHLHSEFMRDVPHCGRLNLAQTRFLFAEFAAEVKSCAVIPLFFTHFNGLLVIASRDETRFHHSMGTLFLTQISQIVSVRLATLLPK